MAFVLQKKGNWSVSANPDAPRAFGVSSATDTLATMSASAYLNTLDKEVRIGDLIYFKATDGNEFVEVTAIAPNVTVQPALQPSTDLPLADADVFVGNASNKAAAVTMSGDATIANTGVLTIADTVIDGDNVAEVVDANAVAGVMVMHTINTPGGVTATTSLIISNAFRVIDVIVQNNAIGTTSDTVYLKNTNSGLSITNAMDISGADATVARAGTIVDSAASLIASGTMSVVQTDGGGSDSPPVTVTVIGVRVA